MLQDCLLPCCRPSERRAVPTTYKALLVFLRERPMVAIMSQSWFRKFATEPRKPAAEPIQAGVENDDADTQFKIGSRLAQGDGTRPDSTLAAEWYLKAANQNHALAQYALGVMFADGRGVPHDSVQALMWISRAAQQGNAAAQHDLGIRHRRASFEVTPEKALESNLEAYKWFRLASAQGNKRSEPEFERVAVRLTREQVMEGNRRFAAFTIAPS